jgi:hypothetical protein
MALSTCSIPRLKAGCCPILHLYPTIEPAAAVGAVTVLTDQPFEAELAGMTEQIRPDLALLERRDVDAVQVWPAFWRLGT